MSLRVESCESRAINAEIRIYFCLFVGVCTCPQVLCGAGGDRSKQAGSYIADLRGTCDTFEEHD